MLTSSATQYFHPDYLQPLPTTLDSKKSPLALLAQTCSSIGKDTSPSKNIIPPLEGKGKDNKASPNHKPGSADARKSPSSEHKKDCSSPNSDSKSSFRAPAPKDIPPLVPITSSSSGSHSSSSKSPVSSSSSSFSSTSVSKSSESITSCSSPLSNSVCAPTPSAGLSSNSRISLSCGNMLLEVNHHESAAAAGLKPGSAVHPYTGKHEGLPTHPSGLIPPYYPHMLPHLPGHHLQMDAASANAAYASGLAAHSAALGLSSSHKQLAGHHGAPGASSPYVAYARVKTASGGSTLVPICRDPYCTNCQIAMNNAQLTSQCGAGCTQCTHEKSALTVPGGLSSALSTSLSLPMYPMAGISSLPGAPSLPSFYPHSMLPAHQGLPYVCNWMAGSEYCGKRFTTSEELLQHLRTHTSSSEAAAINPLAATLPTYSLAGTLPAPGLPGCHSHYAPTPGTLSPNSALRGYPRTLSPSSALRYHPYKPSALSSLQAAPTGLPGLPSVGAYYSPYSLYSQRLAAGGVAP